MNGYGNLTAGKLPGSYNGALLLKPSPPPRFQGLDIAGL